jgi:hypothetical protein
MSVLLVEKKQPMKKRKTRRLWRLNEMDGKL